MNLQDILNGFGVDGFEIAYLTGVFLLGGLVKGVISFGLPLITVPLLSQVLPLPLAIALTVIAVLSTSLVQAYLSRRAYPVLRQVWPMILSLGITIPISARAAGSINPATLVLVVGVFIEVLVVVQWFGIRAAMPQRHRAWVLTLGGIVSGGFGGLTSFYSFPSIQMMVSLRLTADQFAFANNVMFLVGSSSLGLSLGSMGQFTDTAVVLSLWALVPLMLGLAIGQGLRGRIPAEVFRKIVLLVLAATGLSLILRSL